MSITIIITIIIKGNISLTYNVALLILHPPESNMLSEKFSFTKSMIKVSFALIY
jgi:hypothetical protein